MKRIFLIFLLVAVPFQLTWAAVGAYCQHEEGRAAHHFGHHDHKHSDGQSDPAKQLGGDDTDCGMHHSCVKAFITEEVSLPEPAQATAFTLLSLHFKSFIPEGLEKPDRGSLV